MPPGCSGGCHTYTLLQMVVLCCACVRHKILQYQYMKLAINPSTSSDVNMHTENIAPQISANRSSLNLPLSSHLKVSIFFRKKVENREVVKTLTTGTT